jgi:hypothetical protein
MEHIDAGPVDVIFIRFPGARFEGRILPALEHLVRGDTIRVLDLLLVYKDEDGGVGVAELSSLLQDAEGQEGELLREVPGGWLDASDADEVLPGLERDTALAVLAIENLWAIPFVEAVRSAGGEVVDQARVGAELVAAVRRGEEV